MSARSWSNVHVNKLFIVIMFLRQRLRVEVREYAFMKKDNDRIFFPILDLTLLRQTSAERYSSTIDSYAIKLSSILCFFVCVSICVSIYDCVLNRVIERLWVSVIVRLWVHSFRGRLYCDTTYRLMLDWFDTCKQNFTLLFFFVLNVFFEIEIV